VASRIDRDPDEYCRGCRQTGRADRANKFAIARGEAMECGAILDVVRLLDKLPTAELDAAKALLLRIVSMLTKLCLP